MDAGAIRVISIMGALILLMMWVFYMKSKFAKEVVGAVYCEFIPKAGKAYRKLCKIERGTIDLRPRGREGRTFPVSRLATYQDDYPAGFPIPWARATADKAIFYEDTLEPLSRRSETPLASPAMLFNIKNEKFSELAAAASEALMEAENRAKKALNPGAVYVLLVMVLVGVAVAAYFGYESYKSYEVIKAGLGIKEAVLR